jgi:beta-lactamase regulating signal transducer with metallopeptidase domain
MNSAYGKKIIAHEMLHITQKHSYDRFLCQCVCCLFWVNPFFWWAQKELRVVHEFLADEKSLEPGDSVSFATMLLSSYNGGNFLDPDLGFNKSDISRRLSMITAQKRKYSIWKSGVAALMLLVLLTFVIPANSGGNKNKTSSSEQQKKITEFEQKWKDERNNLKLSP